MELMTKKKLINKLTNERNFFKFVIDEAGAYMREKALTKEFIKFVEKRTGVHLKLAPQGTAVPDFEKGKKK